MEAEQHAVFNNQETQKKFKKIKICIERNENEKTTTQTHGTL